MLYLRRISLTVALLVAACSAGEPTDPRMVVAANIAGDYELIRIGNQPLPASTSRRVTVFSGHLQLLTNSRYTATGRSEICVLGACTTRTDTTRGTWLVLQGGGLYFDSEQSYGWPPPPVEADGHEIRFYTSGDKILQSVYERQ
jgi:hypothetical protein